MGSLRVGAAVRAARGGRPGGRAGEGAAVRTPGWGAEEDPVPQGSALAAGCRQHALRGCVRARGGPGQEIRVPAAQPATQGPPQHPDQMPGGPGKGGRKGGQRCPQGPASLKPRPSPAQEASPAPRGSPWPGQPPGPASPTSRLGPSSSLDLAPLPSSAPQQPPHPETPRRVRASLNGRGTRLLLQEAGPFTPRGVLGSPGRSGAWPSLARSVPHTGPWSRRAPGVPRCAEARGRACPTLSGPRAGPWGARPPHAARPRRGVWAAEMGGL